MVEEVGQAHPLEVSDGSERRIHIRLQRVRRALRVEQPEVLPEGAPEGGPTADGVVTRRFGRARHGVRLRVLQR